VAGIFILSLFIHFSWQSYRLNYVYDSDPKNPWVYAHPTDDVFSIEADLNTLANVLPDRYATHIQVIIPDNDYWPLPWYLRHFERVGWWDQIPEEGNPAEIIISVTELDSTLAEFIYNRPEPGDRSLYLPLSDDIYLRPGKKLQLYGTYEIYLKLNDSR